MKPAMRPILAIVALLPFPAIPSEQQALIIADLQPPACPTTGESMTAPATPSDTSWALLDAGAAAVPGSAAVSGDTIDHAGFRQRELDWFEHFLASRPEQVQSSPLRLSLAAAQRQTIDDVAIPAHGRIQVGAAIAVDHAVDFVDATHATGGSSTTAHRQGRLLASSGDAPVWEIGIQSHDAKALRLGFDDLDLAEGAQLFVYNEHGRVEGPFRMRGPDGSGRWLSGSVFGDRVHVRLQADSMQALRTSSFTIESVVHMGRRFVVADVIRDDYQGRSEPDAERGTFCGFDVPPCTVNGVCAMDANPSFANTVKGIAHINFMVGSSSFICTGTLLNSSGSGPRPPYFLTANHCFDTQASATSLEAIYDYRTTTCAGCTPTPTVSSSGATLLATGASPSQPDFTLVRMNSVPAGRWLQGWTTGTIPDTTQIFHLGHPAGSPLTYQMRRLRTSGTGTCPDLPRPTFLYSGLGSAPTDVQGATAGGSSGGAAFVMGGDGPLVVGQLLGSCYSENEPCNADVFLTVDGALSASFPQLRRYLYDGIFSNGFQP